MSEPSSLYLRVTLTTAGYEAFQRSLPAAPREYDDWRPWLDAAQFYGTITDEEIQAMEPASPATVMQSVSRISVSAGSATRAIGTL